LPDESGKAVNILSDHQVEEPRERQPGHEFNQEIAERESDSARAASAAQDQEANERDVVVPTNRLQAVAASRTRPEETLLHRNAVDANVEKAADHCAEHEEKDQQKNRHAV